MSQFPAEFLWGVSTAAYQIEGAATEGGRGPSTWDVFCAEPGRIRHGDTGDVAADHYHRYREDVALMKELGVGAYRFSISWSRVLPSGAGLVNRAGLDFYDRLIDELCAAGITPAVTLFHWDTPQALEEAGGWLNRDMTQRFAEYAHLVGGKLGDRVGMWMPLNEPMVLTLFGYALGNHAPGRTLGFEALPVAHHLLLGHGLATQALRAAGCHDIGIASNHQPGLPASDSPEDLAAAAAYENLVNWLFADPVLAGRYPEGFDQLMPGPVEDDLKAISTPLDWYGINYYQPVRLGAPGSGGRDSDSGGSAVTEGAALPSGLPFEPRDLPEHPKTDFGWAIVPEGLRQILVTFRERYGDRLPPVYITESGCSYHDGPPVDGRVADPERIAYHEGHLRALRQAMNEGVDVRGYFVWSMLDNFEWAEGFRERFGLVHVDYDTLARTPKDSYHWYRDMVAAQRRG